MQAPRRLLEPIGDDLLGHRDRALLLVGFAGALRQSEIAGMRIEDLEHTQRGLQLTIGQIKGSQAEAVTIPLPYGVTARCPCERWTAGSRLDPSSGVRCSDEPCGSRPIERGDRALRPRVCDDALSERSVALTVQARAMAAGVGAQESGGHSLKRGVLTRGPGPWCSPHSVDAARAAKKL